jgi:hypothetical protein
MWLIHNNRQFRVNYEPDGRMRWVELIVRKRHRYSKQIWPDFKSADKAYKLGKVDWDDWIDEGSWGPFEHE